jgi:homoserine kinase
MTAFWVRVPASTSNLGPGFDVLGMAVDAFLEAEWTPGGNDLRMSREGSLATASWPDAEDLVVRGLGVGTEDDLPPVGTLRVRSSIPVGGGLGSSAAARIAGRVLGRLGRGDAVDRDRLVGEVTRAEGHPDNAAPAVMGGLVAARWDPGQEVVTRPLPVSLRLGWVYAMGSGGLSTRAAREALPARVDHAAAVRNAARLAILLPALAAGDGPALREAMTDELHVPFRLPLIPGAADAVRAGEDAGAWAVTLSGAGAGLLGVTPPGAEDAVGRAMAAALEEAAGESSFRILHPWLPGTRWGVGPLSPPDPGRFATSPG